MTVWRYIRVAATVAAVAAPLSRVRAAEPPASQPANAVSADDYVRNLGRTLGEGAPAQRIEAAERLLEAGTPQARRILSDSLAGSDDRARLACARAISQRYSVDPAWIGPLSEMLGRDRPSTEAAAAALARYDTDPAAYGALVQFVQSPRRPNRIAAVAPMGRIVQKSVAEALVTLVNDTAESAELRTAAATALSDLSGQDGKDPTGWRRWLDERSVLNPVPWRDRVLAEQHERLQFDRDRAADRLGQFRARVSDLLLEQYDRRPAAEKGALLLSFLNDPDPDIRAIGASIIPEAVASGQPMTPEMHARLRELIGDADADVRLRVAQALSRFSDPNAFDALATQLRIESDPQVKIELVQAIARTDDRAVPLLQGLLNDPSTAVAAAAADALRTLAPTLKVTPDRARQVVGDLRRVLEDRTGPPGRPRDQPASDGLRAALVEAIAALSGGDAPGPLLDLLHALLSQNESPAVRRAALEGLAIVGDRAGPIIVNQLSAGNEPDPTVREEAARALGQIGSSDYANQLDASSREPAETDPRVQKAAWEAFVSLLPNASPGFMIQWADALGRRHELERQIVVLRLVCDRLDRLQAADHDPDTVRTLAVERQRTGEACLQLSPPQYDQAAEYLRGALDYWENANGGARNPTVVDMVRELMEAYLGAGRYQTALRFGEEQISRDDQNQEQIGPAISHAAEQLIRRGTPADVDAAHRLIQDALAMKPPLDPRYQDQLRTLAGGG